MYVFAGFDIFTLQSFLNETFQVVSTYREDFYKAESSKRN